MQLRPRFFACALAAVTLAACGNDPDTRAGAGGSATPPSEYEEANPRSGVGQEQGPRRMEAAGASAAGIDLDTTLGGAPVVSGSSGGTGAAPAAPQPAAAVDTAAGSGAAAAREP